MDEMHHILTSYSKESISILAKGTPIQSYATIDLSAANKAIGTIEIADHVACQRYIDGVLHKNNAIVAYGGYLEKRSLYLNKAAFEMEGIPRNIHLGIDFWTEAGTKVLTPLNGKVHSFKNNNTFGDYGPTIILQHELENLTFFTLYGHLSLESLENLYIGMEFEKGKVIAFLGSPEINVGYAPHLHFQVICDLQGNIGNYPGVCAEQDLEFYLKNCPDPNLLLKIRP